MRALDRKLLRDLRRIWAQTLAIALVLGCGIMVLIAATTTQSTLSNTRDAYYERQRFADVFSSLTRAPLSVVDQAAQIEGVLQADGRITFQAILDIEGMEEPATARVISLGDGDGLNLPLLRHGRLPHPDRPEEIAVNESFALAHDLRPGARLRAVLNGQLRDLVVVGWLLSPEFVYTMAPGAMMPDDRRFGLIWMTTPAAASARNMAGAVNDITLRLSREADQRAVIAALDDLLAPYGGTGAHGRDLQPSNAFLDGEMQQLQVMARFMPPVFLIVAAFLVNMVLGRLIALERAQIGLLKAVGYSTGEIAWHYLKLALLIGAGGLALGWAFGHWAADGMISLYGDYFRFPFVLRDMGLGATALAAVLGMVTVMVGAGRAVRASVRLPAAEAMSPPAPPMFSRGRVDRAITALRLRQTSMMILRSILRWPGRAAITLFGVAASVAVLVMSYFIFDAVDLMADSVFGQSNRQTVTLTMGAPAPLATLAEAHRLPGVQLAEAGFSVPVRLGHGHRTRLSALQGHFEGAELARLIDDRGGVVAVPSDGVMLPHMLAQALAVGPGDVLEVELLSPPRQRWRVPVAGVVRQGMGQEAHMGASEIFARLGMEPMLNQLHLRIDPAELSALNATIKRTPAVAGLADWAEVRRQFDATLAESLLTMVGIYTLIGVLIAVGVVYNAARIQVSERSHELASLRVLGFSRAEVGFVLVGEIMFLTLIAVPLGWLAGYFMAAGLVEAMSTDLIQIPFVITRRTYALAAAVVVVASFIAVMLVRRRLDRVDLASALKARA